MRCIACDVRLTEREACTRFRVSGEFTELCNKCLHTMDIPTISPKREFEEENDDMEFKTQDFLSEYGDLDT